MNISEQKINELLKGDIEKKKARFVKQTSYEVLGPKATRVLARRLRKQQIFNALNKIRDIKMHSCYIDQMKKSI